MFSSTPQRQPSRRHLALKGSQQGTLARGQQPPLTPAQQAAFGTGTPFVTPLSRNASSPVPPRSSSRASTQSMSPPSAQILGLSPAASVRADDSMEDVESGFGRVEQPAGLVEGEVLVKDENFAVTVYANLPSEVQEALRNADLYIDPFSGHVDPTTGFACLLSRSHCFVWNLSRRGFMSPTCYILPVPQPSTNVVGSVVPLPFAAFVPHGQGREPGLVLASATGEVKFWENVGRALIGDGQAQSTSFALSRGEQIVGLARSEPSLYILSTSQGRLLKLSITSAGGRTALLIAPFSRPLGVLSRIFGSGSGAGAGEIVAVAVGNKDARAGRDVYALGRSVVQQWKASAETGERLIAEYDVRETIAEHFASKPGLRKWNATSKMEFLDAAVARSGQLAVLISAPSDTDKNMDVRSSLQSHAIVVLDVPTNVSASVQVSKFLDLGYQAPRDPRPFSAPKLSFPGAAAPPFVTFPEAIVMFSLREDSTFKEVVRLRDVSKNRLLGAAAPPLSSESTEQGVATLYAITASSGILGFEVSLEALTRSVSRAGPSSDANYRLRATIEKAVFFGDNVKNPIAFNIESDFEGDLNQAAESLSRDILTSNCSNMPPIVDMRLQLADRSQRIMLLINFIRENGLLGKLSQTGRRRLLEDAERMAAANDLWHHQNVSVVEARRRGSDNLLRSVIHTIVSDFGEGFGDDPVRLFFRNHVTELDAILPQVLNTARNLRAEQIGTDPKSSSLFEANQIILLIFDAARRHRTEFAEKYGISANDPIVEEPWTSAPICLEVLHTLFQITNQVILARRRHFGAELNKGASIFAQDDDELGTARKVHRELKAQLCELADFTLMSFEERLGWLEATAVDAEGRSEKDALLAQYLDLRPQVVRPLVSIDKRREAFMLAERYADFRTLTELCNDPTSGDASRIQGYIDRYGQPFAYELFGWLVARGQVRTLLDHGEKNKQLLQDYLAENAYPRITWIQDLQFANYQKASEELLIEADEMMPFEERKLMLSISKLASLARMDISQVLSDGGQQELERFDDKLDLVEVHEELRDLFEQTVAHVSDDVSDTQAELICERLATSLDNSPAFKSLFVKMVKQLIQGNSLTAEGLVDILTLKDNYQEEEADDFAKAIEVLSRVNLPEGHVQACLRTIWRRTLLRDHWDVLSKTTGLSDDEVEKRLCSTALFHTFKTAFQREVDSDFFRTPSQALDVPSLSEVAARFVGMPQEQIDALMADYEAERSRLQTFIDEANLELFFRTVLNMAQANVDV